jgi:uncharacterized protein
VRVLDYVTRVLIIIGGLNWGLVALAEFDLVAEIFGEEFGETNVASRIVYALVGLAALYQIFALAMYASGQTRPVPTGTGRRR